MKLVNSLVLFASLCVFWTGVVSLEACSASTNKNVARTVLELADTLCVLNNSERAVSEIKIACAIKGDLDPAIDELLAAHRAAASRAKAASCAKDGGR